MKFIVGGAFQGKMDFAVAHFGISEAETADGGKCGVNQLEKFTNVKNYHLFVRTLMESGTDPIKFTEMLCEKCNNMIIIMNEVGGGIVPLDETDRKWREMCGKCGCIIAEKSDAVVRVVCGIGTAIKGEI